MSEQPQPSFEAGIVRAAAWHLIPSNGLYDCVDGLLDDDGQIYQRGGMGLLGTLPTPVPATWVWDGTLGPGDRTLVATAAKFYVAAAADASLVDLGGPGLTVPTQAVEVSGLLFIGGGYVYGGSRKAANFSTGTVGVTNGSTAVTGSGFTANVDAGMLLDTGDGRVYRVAQVVSNTALTLAEAYGGSTDAATAYTLRRIKDVSASSYADASHYAVVGDRLFALEGNVLRFSEGRNPTTYALQPHSFLAENQHTLPVGAQGRGLAAIRDRLLIFTTGGMYLLTNTAARITDGSGNEQQRLELAAPSLVLNSAAGLSSWNGVVVAPAQDGVFLVDGFGPPTLLSRSVAPLWQQYVRGGYVAGGAEVFNNHLFLPVVSSTAVPHDVLVCRLDRVVRTRLGDVFPWTRLGGYPARNVAWAIRHASNKLLGAYSGAGAGSVTDCSTLFQAGADVLGADPGGASPLLDVISRRFVTGAGVASFVQRVALMYSLAGAGSVQAFVSVGDAVDTSAKWDAAVWDTDVWAGDGVAGAWDQLQSSAPVNSGLRPFVWQVRRQAEMVAFRFRGTAAATKLRIQMVKPIILDSRRSN